MNPEKLRELLTFDAAGHGRLRGCLSDSDGLIPFGLIDIIAPRPIPTDLPLEPKPEDYIEKDVRMISQTLIGGYLDFTRPGVLEAAVAVAAPVNLIRDHSYQAEDWIGKVLSASWGGPVPEKGIAASGINGRVMVDGKVAPLIVRGMNSDPPTVNRFSVLIDFEYDRSHPDYDEDWWWTNLGEEVDGEIVRVVASRVENIYNLGVVWWGKDDTAQTLSLRREQVNPGAATPRIKEGTMPTPEELAAQIVKLEKDLTAKSTEITDLTAKNTALGKFRDGALAETKAEAVKALTLLNGGKDVPEDDPNLCALGRAIESEDHEYARALTKQFQSRLESELPLVCAKCGGTVTRRQSEPAELDTPPPASLDDDTNAVVGNRLDG